MSMILRRAIQQSLSVGLNVTEVFSTDLWTGNGTTQDIITGINGVESDVLSWGKRRDGSTNHYFFDTLRGKNQIHSNNTNAEFLNNNGITSFNVDGFSLGDDVGLNALGSSDVSWSFKKAPKFFDVIKYTGGPITNSVQIPHNLGVEPGLCIVKNLTLNVNWAVQHRSLGGVQFLQLDSNAAAVTDSNYWYDTDMNATDVTVGTNNRTHGFSTGDEYIMYAFAHDPNPEGVIQCGEFDGSDTNKEIDLGWAENAQYVIIKPYDNTGDWETYDSGRGDDNKLTPNEASVEVTTSRITLDSNGFSFNFTDSKKYIYMAIRAPSA